MEGISAPAFQEEASAQVSFYEWQLAHGICVGIEVPAEIGPDCLDKLLSVLHPTERHAVETFPEWKKSSWIAGRLAAHEALRRLGFNDNYAVLNDSRGAPLPPSGYTLSISHKKRGPVTLAVALADRSSAISLGMDIEALWPMRMNIAHLVCTEREILASMGLSQSRRWRDVLLRFSMKEAVYKAVDPFVRRTLDFSELSLDLYEDGRADATWTVLNPLPNLFLDVRWMLWNDWVLASARTEKAPE